MQYISIIISFFSLIVACLSLVHTLHWKPTANIVFDTLLKKEELQLIEHLAIRGRNKDNVYRPYAVLQVCNIGEGAVQELHVLGRNCMTYLVLKDGDNFTHVTTVSQSNINNTYLVVFSGTPISTILSKHAACIVHWRESPSRKDTCKSKTVSLALLPFINHPRVQKDPTQRLYHHHILRGICKSIANYYNHYCYHHKAEIEGSHSITVGNASLIWTPQPPTPLSKIRLR